MTNKNSELFNQMPFRVIFYFVGIVWYSGENTGLGGRRAADIFCLAWSLPNLITTKNTQNIAWPTVNAKSFTNINSVYVINKKFLICYELYKC